MRPLEGKRVLVTRAREQADDLCDALAREGATPVRFPAIQIRPVADLAPLDEAIDRLENYDWLGLTSVNGVRIFLDRVRARGRHLPSTLRIAAVGPSTAQALEDQGIRVDFIPEAYRGDRMAEGMGSMTERRVLLPRALGARPALPEALTAAGAEVYDLAIYRTVPAVPAPESLVELERGVDIATFTSASTVRCFRAIVGGDAARALGSALIACLGPLTADAARGAGLRVALQPLEYTAEGLVNALVRHCRPEQALP